MTEKDMKLRDLTILYDKLLKHLDGLAKYTTSIEDVKANIDTIKEMNTSHIETRDFARELLSYDFSKVAPNFLVAFMFKEINSQSILFINLVTDYNERLIKYVEENDMDNLKILIKDVTDFNETAKKQFKPLKAKLEKMVKTDDGKQRA